MPLRPLPSGRGARRGPRPHSRPECVRRPVMNPDPVFTITYWGVTGTLTAPLRPPEVTDKLVSAIERLVEQGLLADLRPGPDLHRNIRRLVERELPFPLRTS